MDLHVGLHDAQIDAGKIDLARVLLFTMTDECEMGAKVLSGLADVVLRSRFVMEETKLESGLCLGFVHVWLGGGSQREDVQQMFDSLLGVVSLGISLSQELVSLDLLFNIVCLLAQLQELLPMLNSSIKLTLSLINHTDLLIALSLTDSVLSVL